MGDTSTLNSSLTVVDVVVIVAVVLAVAGALRRRAGLLGAAGAALGAVVVGWLATVALAAWGPEATERLAADSALLELVPAPTRAVDQTGRLVGDLFR